MRLADDRRGRVPFALVGVVLLVASGAYATGVERQTSDAEVTSDSAAALREAEAATRSSLHAAVRHAAREAARRPVVTPSDGPYGQALRPDQPFSDALRLRIYLAATRAFDRSAVRVGQVEARARLPVPSSPEEVEAAVRRVRLTESASGDLRVAIRDVRVDVRRAGRTVATRVHTPRIDAPVAVLALHDAAQRYESRLNAGPTGGFGRRVTATLAVVAWARGYAQFGGAPIENVVGNAHLELLVNRALLAEQSAVFGTADPNASETLARTAVETGLAELLRAGGVGGEETAEGLTGAAGAVERAARSAAGNGTGGESRRAAAANASFAVGVDGSADAAYESVLDGDPSDLETVTSSLATSPNRSDAAVAEIRRRLRLDLASLRERVRNVTVEPDREAVLAGEGLEQLLAAFDRRRERLREPTESLAGVPRRTRTAARRTYLDAVESHLRRRAEAESRAFRRVRERLAEPNLSVEGAARGGVSTGRDPAGAPPRSVRRVEGEPGYLSRTPPAGNETDARAPLALENVNWFAVPDGVADGGWNGSSAGGSDGGSESGTDGDSASGSAGGSDSGSPRGVAGLPVTPIPGYWYATVNGWTARIEGRHPRLAVTAPAIGPTPGPNVTYVRESARIALDVNGDGEREHLGSNRPVSFALETASVVVVPPGARGVGDRGERTERSPAWAASTAGNETGSGP